MNKTQTNRLLNVARILREASAAKKKFDMEKYVFGDENARRDNYDSRTGEYKQCNEEAEFCGTPACALGHYAAHTNIQRILKIAVKKNHAGVKFAELQVFGTDEMASYDDDRVMNHFGLNVDEMEELFGGWGCGEAHTPLQAAKYIERFVKQKTAKS